METFQLLEGSLLHWMEVLVLSGIKFAFAPALSMGLGFSYFHTILITSIGGLAGVYFFYFLSDHIIKLWNNSINSIIPLSKKLKPIYLSVNSKSYQQRSKKTFTLRNKAIVKTRSSFGIRGIAILTPVLLSIPLGAFLVSRYYGNDKKKFLYLTISVVLWSFLVTSTLFFIRSI